MMNVMLISSFAPSNLWGEAVLITYFLQNRIRLSTQPKIPRSVGALSQSYANRP